MRVGGPIGEHVDEVDGARRRRVAAVLFTVLGGGLTLWAGVAAAQDGFGRPFVAIALGVALVGANLAPVVAVSGGRIDAFTPVGALLVPIGLLLPLPEAIVVYAVGESAGVLAAHRWDRHVGGPEADAAPRTAFVVGKSIVGAVLGLVALQQVARTGSPVPAQVLAAFVGVAVSTAFDRSVVAALATLVGGLPFAAEFRRGVGELLAVAGAEVVAGALIAVLAGRDPWSLVLGLVMFALLLVAGSAYARASADREDTRELLRLAGELQEARTAAEVEEALLASVRRLLPQDPVTISPDAPDGSHRGWALGGEGEPRRWLTTPRIIATRDYEQQPMAIVDAAASLAHVALTRASAQEALLEQDRLRSLILSTVVHDLRTPLAIASGGLEMLTGSGGKLDDDQRTRLLSASSRAVGRMRRLIEGLLGLERTTEGSGDQGGGGAAVADVVRTMAAELDLGEVVLVLDAADVSAAIDPVSLERIIENLVLNAAKYSPEGGTVAVVCTPDGGGVRIVIEDEGPGVAPEDRYMIFEPFRQADRERGGVGLGLYVARRFVETHGGRIWVEASGRGGAAFHVWLPGVESSVSPSRPGGA